MKVLHPVVYELVIDPQLAPITGDFQFTILLSTSLTYTLQYFTGQDLDYTIDWGDGTRSVVNSFTASQRTHTYSSSGEKIVTILNYKSGYFYFYNDSVLIDILTPLPKQTGRTNFDFCFQTTSIKTIPKDFFINCYEAQSIMFCFADTPITKIPDGLFDYCSELTSVAGCFFSCLLLTYIPEKLFYENTKIYIGGATFGICASLKALPSKLFRCINSGWYGEGYANFADCFTDCYSLISIPEDLFELRFNAPQGRNSVIYLNNLFMNNYSLQSIPEKLFDNCPEIYDITFGFAECIGLTGKAPELWLRREIESFSGCFYNCTGLSNYNEIPDNWK